MRSMSMLDFIESKIKEEKETITKSQFKWIRNNGTEEELEKAVEKMMQAGGYENLAD